MARYVQNKYSKSAPKYEVRDVREYEWEVFANGRWYFLPKAEYVEVIEPEERWEQCVTVLLEDMGGWLCVDDQHTAKLPLGYRWGRGWDGQLIVMRRKNMEGDNG